MALLDDLLSAIQQKMYSNPYVGQQQQPPTIGQLAGGDTPLGAGAAADAGIDLKIRPLYLKHVMAAQEQGQQPMPYDQFKAAVVQAMQQR